MSALGPVARMRDAKTRLRVRIAARRRRCSDLMACIVRPLRWVDRVETWWRSLGPWARAGGTLAALLAWRWARPASSAQATADKVTGWNEILRWLCSRWA